MEELVRLWSHQRKAVEAAKDKASYGLFLEVGTGKSATLINILRHKYKKHGVVLRTLIFSPPITLQNWYREWGMHSKIQSKVCVLYGSETARLKEFEKQEADIYVTNYEALLMKKLYKAFQEWGVSCVVSDESHKIKDVRAKRTKLLIELSDQATYKYILTGSPILNTPMDIFSQYRFLDGGLTFGKNFFSFRATYFYDANASMPRDRYFPNWKIRPGALEQINTLIYEKAMRVKKEDCLDLPPLVKETYPVEMSPEQAKAYNEMKRDFITYINDTACVASLALTKAGKLLQICSGFLNLDENTTHEFKSNPRQQALSELLETICVENKVLVWACYRRNYAQIARVCESLGLQYVEVHGETPSKSKQEAVDRFTKDPTCKVFIGHPGSAGIGINLVEASYSIWYSRSFSLEYEIQAEARNYRGGSEIHEKITRIDLVTPDSIDEYVMKALANKVQIGEKVLRDLASQI